MSSETQTSPEHFASGFQAAHEMFGFAAGFAVEPQQTAYCFGWRIH